MTLFLFLNHHRRRPRLHVIALDILRLLLFLYRVLILCMRTVHVDAFANAGFYEICAETTQISLC